MFQKSSLPPHLSTFREVYVIGFCLNFCKNIILNAYQKEKKEKKRKRKLLFLLKAELAKKTNFEKRLERNVF